MTDATVVPPAPQATAAVAVPAPRELNIPFVLMCIVAAGFIGMLLVMSFHDVPPGNKDMLTTLMGSLGTGFGLVVGFYFGSSASSKAKDDTIATLSK